MTVFSLRWLSSIAALFSEILKVTETLRCRPNLFKALLLVSFSDVLVGCGMADENAYWPIGQLEDGSLVWSESGSDEYLTVSSVKVLRGGRAREFNFQPGRIESIYLKGTSSLVVVGDQLLLFGWPPGGPIDTFEIYFVDLENGQVSEGIGVEEVEYNPYSGSIALRRQGGWTLIGFGLRREVAMEGRRVLDHAVQGESHFVLVSEIEEGRATIAVFDLTDDGEPVARWSLDGVNYDRFSGSEIVYAGFTRDEGFFALVSRRRTQREGEGYDDLPPIWTEIIVKRPGDPALETYRLPPDMHQAAVVQFVGIVADCHVFLFSQQIAELCADGHWNIRKYEDVAPDARSAPLVDRASGHLVYITSSGDMRHIVPESK